VKPSRSVEKTLHVFKVREDPKEIPGLNSGGVSLGVDNQSQVAFKKRNEKQNLIKEYLQNAEKIPEKI